MKPLLVAAVTVMLTTTADTPAHGPPPTPVTFTATEPLAGTAARAAPTPVRVSNTRYGATAPNAPAATGTDGWTTIGEEPLRTDEAGGAVAAFAPPGIAPAISAVTTIKISKLNPGNFRTA